MYPFCLVIACLAAQAQTGTAAGATPKPAAAAKSSATPAAAKVEPRTWLDANLSSPDFAARLERFAREEDKPETALGLLSDYYPSLRDAAGRKACAALAGEYCELESEYAAAAGWYEKAVQAPEGPRDAQLRLRSAYCLMAIGEFGRAEGVLEALAAAQAAFDPAGDLSAALRLKARAGMAGFWLSLFSGRTEGLEAALLAFLEDEGAKASRPEGLLLLSFLQWRAKAADAVSPKRPADTAYGKRLLKEYPESPEARVCAEVGSGLPKAGLRLAESPLWLMSGFLVRDPDDAFSGLGRLGEDAQAPAPSPGAKVSSAPPDPAGQRLVSFQVGSFAQKANAEGLVSRLRAQSFKAEMRESKNVKGRILFVVLVAAGDDPRDTDLRLKEAGIEALPLFE